MPWGSGFPRLPVRDTRSYVSDDERSLKVDDTQTGGAFWVTLVLGKEEGYFFIVAEGKGKWLQTFGVRKVYLNAHCMICLNKYSCYNHDS